MTVPLGHAGMLSGRAAQEYTRRFMAKTRPHKAVFSGKSPAERSAVLHVKQWLLAWSHRASEGARERRRGDAHRGLVMRD